MLVVLRVSHLGVAASFFECIGMVVELESSGVALLARVVRALGGRPAAVRRRRRGAAAAAEPGRLEVLKTGRRRRIRSADVRGFGLVDIDHVGHR